MIVMEFLSQKKKNSAAPVVYSTSDNIQIGQTYSIFAVDIQNSNFSKF